MPADWGRSQLEGLGFVDRHECPRALRERRHPRRTHLAIALGRAACRNGIPTRFLRRLKPGHEAETSQTGQPARPGAYDDRQGQAHHPRTGPDRIPIDEKRRPPALPDHRGQLRDKEHHPRPPTSSPADGPACSATPTRHAAAGDRTDPPRTTHPLPGRKLPQSARPHGQTANKRTEQGGRATQEC